MRLVTSGRLRCETPRRTVGARWLAAALCALLLVATPAPSSAETEPPQLDPRPVVFTYAEKSSFEEARAARSRRNLLLWGGSAFLALVAGGVTLLALGLREERGKAGLVSGGISSLSAAVAGGFVAYEVAEW